jgi:hypothetical protein
MDRAADAIGLRFDKTRYGAVDRPRQVNSTAAPSLARWRRERPELRALLDIPEVAEVSELLGYDVAAWSQWP